jgi:lysozyme
MSRQINVDGKKLIMSFEGCKLEAYKDQAGIYTIGYGQTGPHIKEGLIWTQEQAEEALAHTLSVFEHQVELVTPAFVNDNQFSALVSFSYNLGFGSLRKSTLLHFVEQNLMLEAAEEFLKWNKVAGIVNAGLTRRRQAEKDLFLK